MWTYYLSCSHIIPNWNNVGVEMFLSCMNKLISDCQNFKTTWNGYDLYIERDMIQFQIVLFHLFSFSCGHQSHDPVKCFVSLHCFLWIFITPGPDSLENHFHTFETFSICVHPCQKNSFHFYKSNHNIIWKLTKIYIISVKKSCILYYKPQT